MKAFRVAALNAFSLFTFACAAPPEQEVDLNPLTCGASNDDVTLNCSGTGVDGDLYDCLCSRPHEFNFNSCPGNGDSECAPGEKCFDKICNEVASFTDLTICIDGISAGEVAERCAGLPTFD